MDRIKLMNSLLLSMPGSPIIYYGDEIGMGDNIFLGDRNGVRTPMQWSPDRNAGFSRADPQRLYLPAIQDPIYGYEAVNVEAQLRDPGSLLNWMRRMLAVRKTSHAFGRGKLTFLRAGNRKILAYLRELDDEAILCVANLGRSAQPVELDHNALFHALRNEAFHSSILTMKLDGAASRVLLRDVQMHPFKNEILHVDFQRVEENRQVKMRVPLHFVNAEVSPAVKLSGALVSHITTEVEIACLPKDLPEFVEADLANLGLNEILHLSEIQFPSGVSSVALAHGQDLPVASIHPPRRQEVDEEETAAGTVEAEAAPKPDEDD